MDVVYPCRPGENEELRYSIRSLTNLPHDTIWTVGGRPSWLNHDHHIDIDQARTKYQNSSANIRAAIHDDRISDTFYLFNDDFFTIEPLDHLPTLHRGPLVDVLGWYETKHPKGYYTLGMRNTYNLLTSLGFTNPSSYELHMPMPVDRAKAKRAYGRVDKLIEQGRAERPLHWRTLYGNLARIGGTQVKDCKVYDRHSRLPEGPFASTNDIVFRRGAAGVSIRRMFTEPSDLENS